MKTHPAFKRVLAAARKQLKREQGEIPKSGDKLKEAIAVVKLFVDDNHEYIQFYNDDAGL